MKAHLLFAERELHADAPEPGHAEDLVADLEVNTLLDAMGAGDQLIRAVSRSVLLHGLTDPAQIGYRQHVLTDCLRHADAVRALYDLAGEAIAAERSVFRGFFSERPESLLHRSVQVMGLFVEALKKLRRSATELAPQFRSDGFRRFFAMVTEELDDGYFEEINRHLKLLRFGGGLLVSARLGRGNEGTDFVLRRPKEENRSLFNRAGLRKPTFSYTIPDRDDAGMSALGDLHDRALNEVGNAAAQSCDHVLSFFQALRAELAFYLGCFNLHQKLTALGAPVCFPAARPPDSGVLSAAGLYDVCLCLRMQQPVVANTLAADGVKLIMITGANQGGKSTFLRSIGLAQLMMSAGMFTCAQQLTAATRTGVYTHFKREEDDTMASGKFDEELARMSELADQIRPHGLLLCNESFQSTNEREGSEIGRQVIRAMVDADVAVIFVTHLYDLAHGFHAEDDPARLFLRAERDPDGQRTFRVIPGEPLPTSYGKEIYDRIFTAP